MSKRARRVTDKKLKTEAFEVYDLESEEFSWEEQSSGETAEEYEGAEEAVYTEEIEYTEEAEYPEEAAYTEEAEYLEEAEYPEEAAYTEETGYTEEAEYPEEEIYTEEAEYPEETEYTEYEAVGEAEEASVEELPEASELRKSKGWLKWFIPLLVVLLAVVSVLGIWLYEKSQVYGVCRVEAGVAVSVADFLKKPNETALFTEDSDVIDITKPGEYRLKIKLKFFEHPCTLYIADTIAPVVEAQPLRIQYGKTCAPEDFLVSVEDATKTKVLFEVKPDFTKQQEQAVRISVTDAGNNTTTVETTLDISLLVSSVVVEAGSGSPKASDFVLADADVKILTDMETIDFTIPATHNVDVELNGEQYQVPMEICDTVPPVFGVQDLEKFTLCERKAEDFVTECTDATEVTYSFETEPDLTKVGTQTVTIIGTDAGGNSYSAQAQLTLAEDTEAPTIKGEANVLVYVGDSVSYKAQVKAQDNCPEGLNLEVDASAVNLNEAGTYSVIYTATDCAGNAATFTMNLTVHERQYTLEEANALADKILGKIITDDMTLYDKALAIFNYVKGHIGYVSYSEKGDYVKSAYEGLMSGKGDCYNYASASKLLLDRAGIPNMDIERIPSGNSMHYWNLVDIGDGHGWYHFDTTPRKDRPTIFLWNDAQIKEYSDKHNNCHNYDRELYPVIN